MKEDMRGPNDLDNYWHPDHAIMTWLTGSSPKKKMRRTCNQTNAQFYVSLHRAAHTTKLTGHIGHGSSLIGSLAAFRLSVYRRIRTWVHACILV